MISTIRFPNVSPYYMATDGRNLYALDMKIHGVLVISATTGKFIHKFAITSKPSGMQGIAYDMTRKKLYVSTDSGQLYEMNVDGSNQKKVADFNGNGDVDAIFIQGDDVYLTLQKNNRLGVWNSKTSKVRYVNIEAQAASICALPNGWVRAGQSNKVVTFFDKNWNALHEIKGFTEPWSVKCSVCGDVLITELKTKVIHLVNREGSKVIYTDDSGEVRDVHVIGTDYYALLADGRVRILNTKKV